VYLDCLGIGSISPSWQWKHHDMTWSKQDYTEIILYKTKVEDIIAR
jgi:hypothetical protein